MPSIATIARHTLTWFVSLIIVTVVTLAAVVGIGLVKGTVHAYNAGSTGIQMDYLGGFDLRGPGAPGFFRCDGQCGI